ncbi:gephyrin-like molybdotransferase Glp [Hydrogenophaga sp. PAMC20947]|uniref:molybdopterin molybdotransferase MoeA n=1 Tax=Hydrogenophaga sp. PAMC20947 TaxID=2565558 RepID=UPI00109E2758|nr:gephyrin-like molybdotransferase Glp [Hydrogenophaga sp. PAMC20947]QCB45634.1 molybdopterin molybdotransferase MoeA [Hydrogenophaga sp. PAMC20947]
MTTASCPPDSDLSVDEVLMQICQRIQPVTDSETVNLAQALGRVLSKDVVSPLSVPPHDNSAMDGYAFEARDLSPNTPLSLTVVGTALAGKAWTQTLQAGECVKIMTGAIMPPGLDTVVPLELTERTGDTVHVAPGTLKPGANRRRLGEDLMAGEPALLAGQRVTPAALGLLASLGLQTLTVFRRLRVAYFSTGDEILSLGEAPREGAVFDSNRYTLTSLMTRMGVDVIDMGVVPDQPATLRAAFERAGQEADAVLTSGGVSMGDADHTRTIIQQLGQVDFWRIAMRPGRPMAFGRLGAAPDAGAEGGWLFGLPGNPVAAMVTFLVLVRPALLRLMGCSAAPLVLLKARCTQALRKRPGRSEFQRGIVAVNDEGVLCVRTTGPQGSGVLSSMVQANGLIVLHHDQGEVAAGEEVDVMMFEGAV